MAYKPRFQRSEGANLRSLAADEETLLLLSQNAAAQSHDEPIARGELQAVIVRLHRVRPQRIGHEVRWVVQGTLFDGDPVEIVILRSYSPKRITVLSYQRLK